MSPDLATVGGRGGSEVYVDPKECFRHSTHCCGGLVCLEVFPYLVRSQNTGNLLLACGGLSFLMPDGKQESWLLMTECLTYWC